MLRMYGCIETAAGFAALGAYMNFVGRGVKHSHYLSPDANGLA